MQTNLVVVFGKDVTDKKKRTSLSDLLHIRATGILMQLF